jgi:glycosyltransferase involved in cell wall biosynthesis
MAAFSFIQPPGTHLAGGGAYITGLIAALQAAGHDAVVQTGIDLPGDRIAVIDGLALPAFPPDAVDNAVGLIHHTAALAGADIKPAIRAAERILLPRLRRVVATSETVGARLIDAFGVLPDRLTIIPPGVPDAPRSAGSGGASCAILSVGALVPRKGHAVLLRALARLYDLDWHLTIVGDDQRDPAHAAVLRNRAAAAGLAGRVTFAGALNDLEPLWRSADLFALATEWEGHAAAVAEALSRGLPVAVTAGGAAAEGVTPDSGIIVQPGDSDGLSRAMRRLIFDPALRTDMAQAAWETGQTLPRWTHQAARFVEATI